MKKSVLMILAALMALTGVAALAEAGAVGEIVDGSYVIRIPDENGDLAWLADDMEGFDSVVKLAEEGLKDGEYVVRYEPVGDGDAVVEVRHYTGVACDQVYGWELTVKDGAVTAADEGWHDVSPDPAESDPYLIGEWETEDGMAAMTIEKNPGGRAWDVEIVAAQTQGAYVFKTTIYFDCELNSFVYDKGKYWEVPITDSEEEPELGEAAVAGATGSFTFTGDPGDLWLSWVDDTNPEEMIDFRKQG